MIDIKKDIRVTNITPFVEAGLGTAIHFTYKGRAFTYETWAVGGTSGADYYPVTPLDGMDSWDPSDEEVLDEFMESVLEIWGEQYDQHVTPALETAVHNARIGVEDTVQELIPGEGLT